MSTENLEKSDYWKQNLRIIMPLMVVWFVVSFGCGIILVDVLNTVQVGGYKPGFWFAQQGSIYVFVALIFIYAKKMARLYREFGVDDDQ